MMVKVKCVECKKEFEAKKADIKRGWGKFCNKSCKAIHQTRKTGRGKPSMSNGLFTGFHHDSDYNIDNERVNFYSRLEEEK